MAERMTQSDWRLVHGLLFVLLMGAGLLVGPVREWPWLWIVPLACYFLLVVAIAPLRRSFGSVRAGRLSSRTMAATALIILLATAGLVLFHKIAKPDAQSYGSAFPWEGLGGVVLSGILFSILNAASEELVFRGILFDALESQWGTRITILGTALLFAFGHLHGYPPGRTGACLAGVYGLALGALRAWTGGLILPIIAHIAADATIYALLRNSV